MGESSVSFQATIQLQGLQFGWLVKRGELWSEGQFIVSIRIHAALNAAG
jgi:hypothetical protein